MAKIKDNQYESSSLGCLTLDMIIKGNKFKVYEQIEQRYFVYLLIDNNEVVYVGKTISLDTRIKSHKKDKVFDKVWYLDFKECEYSIWEEFFIIGFNPKYNNDIILQNARNDKLRDGKGSFIICDTCGVKKHEYYFSKLSSGEIKSTCKRCISKKYKKTKLNKYPKKNITSINSKSYILNDEELVEIIL